MAAIEITNPYPLFTELNGDPLCNGFIYIGTANLDPVTNPISVYWDVNSQVEADQPIRTINGYASRSGTPSTIYTNSDYSITVKDKNGLFICTSSSATNPSDTITSNLANTANVSLGDYLVGQHRTLIGAVATTDHKFHEDRRVNIKTDFGAIGDGNTDDSASIQAAVDAHDDIYFPPGTYIIGSTINITSGNKRLSGAGPSSVLKMKTGANLSRLVFFSGAQSATVEYLKFDGNRVGQTTPTFGGLLDSSNTPNTVFCRVHAVDSYTDGIDIRTGTGHGVVSECFIDNCRLTGIKITDTQNSRAISNTLKNCQTHIQLVQGDSRDIVVVGNTIIGDDATISTYGVLVVPGSTTLDTVQRFIIGQNTISGCANTGGGGIILSSNVAAGSSAFGIISGNVISGCYAGIASSNTDNFNIVGNAVTLSDSFGVSLSGCTNVIVSGNIITENDNTSGTPYSIQVVTNATSGDSDKITISSNIINNSTTTNSPTGIRIGDASQTNIIIENNHLTGCTTPIYGAANAKRISNNTGYVSEANGTATITNGTTEVDVTHGVSFTPNQAEVTIMPGIVTTNDFGPIWVNSATSTTFTVKCRADPGASGLPFFWTVRRL